MNYALAFLVSFVYIGAKATQQLQVVNFQWGRILPLSIVMGFCEVFIVVNVVHTAASVAGLVLLALCIGSGSGLGALSAMYLYKRRG